MLAPPTKGSAKPFSRSQLAKAAAHAAAILSRAEAAHGSRKSKLFRHIAVQYLQSHDAHVLATLAANRSMKWSRRPHPSMLPSIAALLNPWTGSDEPVTVLLKTKPNGNYRLVIDFGIERRALQHLLIPLLQTAADLHPYQYATRGGVPQAIDYVAASMLEGFLYTVETDIAACFLSFVEGGVCKVLPLPKKVVRHIIMAGFLNVVPGTSILHHFGPEADGYCGDPIAVAKFLAEARTGIPQGSAVSPLIAEMLLSAPLKALPSVGRAVNYADNTLTMAKTEADAVAMLQAFWGALEGHKAGPLLPKIKSHSKPGETVEFLGHTLLVVGDIVEIKPSPDNDFKFTRRVHFGLASLNDTSLSKFIRRKKARDLKMYIRSWTSAFSRCGGMSERRSALLSKVNTIMKKTGVS